MSSRTRASSPGGGIQMDVGTYTGDGVATQAIVGVGFQPRWMIIYSHLDDQTSDMGIKSDQDGLNSLAWRSGWLRFMFQAGHIVSFDADGFTVGGVGGFANVLNVDQVVYTYVAFR